MASKNEADNIYEEFEPRMISSDEIHAMLAAQAEEINALKAAAAARKIDLKDDPIALHGGEPVTHHLHLVDGRVITDHGGIGTHYSEPLPDGGEKVTRIREYFPADEVHPNQAYA